MEWYDEKPTKKQLFMQYVDRGSNRVVGPGYHIIW